MKVVYRGGEAEIVEKKSRFLATVKPVNSETEALEFVSEMKKRHQDATHNCSAFVLGEHFDLQRCSDDGEPTGTAGRPMLEVLLGEDVHDTAVVVTRYFGGTLLGTGGLVRAYSKSVQEGLNASTIVEKEDGVVLTIRTDYSGIGRIQYLLSSQGYAIVDSEYTDDVKIRALLPRERRAELRAQIMEVCAGKAELSESEPVTYAMLDGAPIIF